MDERARRAGRERVDPWIIGHHNRGSVRFFVLGGSDVAGVSSCLLHHNEIQIGRLNDAALNTVEQALPSLLAPRCPTKGKPSKIP